MLILLPAISSLRCLPVRLRPLFSCDGRKDCVVFCQSSPRVWPVVDHTRHCCFAFPRERETENRQYVVERVSEAHEEQASGG